MVGVLIGFAAIGYGWSRNQPGGKETEKTASHNEAGSTLSQLHQFDTLLTINNQRFQIHTKNISEDEVTLTVLCESECVMVDTISPYGFSNIEFPDFNGDGNADIMLSYSGNITSYNLYLFDEQNSTFKPVEGFSDYPEAVRLNSNPSYYYSYHRAGCADMNWVSDLFYIESYKTVHVAHLYTQGCDYEDEGEKDERHGKISVYKVNNGSKDRQKLVERLPVEAIHKYNNKWDFIEKYWNASYKKYE